MATLHGRKRKLTQKIQSGSPFLEVFGMPVPVVPMKIDSENVEAGWGVHVNGNMKVISTTSNEAMFGLTSPIYQRFLNEKGELCAPIQMRGLAYTHRGSLINPGDVKGNLICVGDTGEVVDPGGVGGLVNSRVVIIGKKRYKA